MRKKPLTREQWITVIILLGVLVFFYIGMYFTLTDEMLHPYAHGKVCDQPWRWGKCRDLQPGEVCEPIWGSFGEPSPWNCSIKGNK